MENQETKISNVTTSMKVEKEINGFKVSGTVEVYNDSKRIKRIDASVQKQIRRPWHLSSIPLRLPVD